MIFSLLLLVFNSSSATVNAQATIDCDDPAAVENLMVALGATYYGPCDTDSPLPSATGSCSDTTSGSLAGSSNAEKIWNFYTEKGLSQLAVAGIMGNYSEETGATFDPAIKQNNSLSAIPDNGNGSTGFGIAQWTNQTRQAGLFVKIREAGLQKYYGAGYGHPEINKTKMSQADIDALLLVELNYSWEGDTTKIKDLAQEMNKLSSVSGDSGTTVYFHAKYEGSADNASQIQERVTSAQGILDQFGDSSSTVGSGCAGVLGGVSTMEDAIPWGLKFIADTKDNYNPGGRSLNNQRNDDGSISMYVTNDGVVGDGGGCWGATYCGQCTALSGWFVTVMTDYTYGGGNGEAVVANLGTKGVPTGNKPKPYSIFSYNTSSVGHTGIVLGVLDNGEVITLENNLSANTLKIFKYNITKEHPDVRFAYVGDKLKDKGLSPVN